MKKTQPLRLLALLCIGLFPISLYAQNPGYLGKKNIFAVSYSMAPNIDGPNKNNEGFSGLYKQDFGEKGKLTLSSKWGVTYERALAKNTSVKLSYDQFATGATIYGQGLYDDFGLTYYRELETFQEINGKEIELGFKFFSTARGSIAPMGAYYGLNIGYGMYNYDVKDYDSIPYQNFSTPIRPYKMSGIVNDITIGGEIGVNQIIKDKVFLNLNLKTRLPVSGLGSDQYDAFIGSAEYDEFNKDQLEEADTELQQFFISQRVVFHNILMFSIQLGYLF